MTLLSKFIIKEDNLTLTTEIASSQLHDCGFGAERGVVRPGPTRSNVSLSRKNPNKVPKDSAKRKPKEPLEELSQKQKNVSNVIESVDVIIDVFRLMGIERPKDAMNDSCRSIVDDKWSRARNSAIKRAVDFVELTDDPKAWIQYFKYKISAYFSYWHDQPIPPKPQGLEEDHPGIILGGPFYYQQHKLRWKCCGKGKYGYKIHQLALSVLMSKKGMPRADLALMVKACEDTVRVLCTKPICEDPIQLSKEGKTGFYSRFWEETVRTIEEIFEGHPFTVSDWYKFSFASPSAAYNRTRGNLGGIGAVRDVLGIRSGTFDLNEVKKFHGLDQVVEAGACPEIGVSYCEHRLFGEQSDSYRPSVREAFEAERNLTKIGPVVINAVEKAKETWGIEYNLEDLEKHHASLFSRLINYAMDEIPAVEPVALAEALKIRVISKGPAITYHVLRPLQKFLWKTLKSNKVFELIGKTVNEDIIKELLGDFSQDFLSYALSGDFKASTDNLYSWVSNMIVDAILACFERQTHVPEQLKVLFKRSLTGHGFADEGWEASPEMKQEWVDSGYNPIILMKYGLHVQENGQLMGSITSFPILCIANVIISRMSLEETTGIRYRVTDRRVRDYPLLPCRVNGDDSLLKGPSTLYDVWARNSAAIGLEPSVGKVYFSKHFAVINSVTFDFWETEPLLVQGLKFEDVITSDKDGKMSICYKIEREHGWAERKFVNFGLLYGVGRVAGEASCDGLGMDLGCKHRELFRTCPEDLWEKVSNYFLYKHAGSLKKFQIPWFIPEWLGGRGLTPSSDYKISSVDLRTCSVVRYQYIENKPAPLVKKSFWRMHKNYRTFIEGLGLSELNFTYSSGLSLEEENSHLYQGYLMYALYGKTSLWEDSSSKGEEYRILKHNEKLWLKAQKLASSFEEMKVEDLVSVKLEKYYPVRSAPKNI